MFSGTNIKTSLGLSKLIYTFLFAHILEDGTFTVKDIWATRELGVGTAI